MHESEGFEALKENQWPLMFFKMALSISQKKQRKSEVK